MVFKLGFKIKSPCTHQRIVLLVWRIDSFHDGISFKLKHNFFFKLNKEEWYGWLGLIPVVYGTKRSQRQDLLQPHTHTRGINISFKILNTKVFFSPPSKKYVISRIGKDGDFRSSAMLSVGLFLVNFSLKI